MAAASAGPADLLPGPERAVRHDDRPDWNVKHSGAGFVTRFDVAKEFVDRYEVQQVGGRTIVEYWIPAEDLDEFNANIVGMIEVVAEYR